jgi:hypothetical protein
MILILIREVSAAEQYWSCQHQRITMFGKCSVQREDDVSGCFLFGCCLLQKEVDDEWLWLDWWI